MTRRDAILAVSLLAVIPLAGADFERVLAFTVTDTRDSFTVALGRDVVLRADRETDSAGRHMGWYFSATDRRLAGSPNFFYDCLCGHGPRPNDLFAWHFVERLYPGDRILPVYGYPMEVRVRCLNCEVAGAGAESHFVAGAVEVSWRRLAESNRRQLRIADLGR